MLDKFLLILCIFYLHLLQEYMLLYHPTTTISPIDGSSTLTNVNGCPSGSSGSLLNGYTSTGVSSSVFSLSGLAIGFALKHLTLIVTVAELADTNDAVESSLILYCNVLYIHQHIPAISSHCSFDGV